MKTTINFEFGIDDVKSIELDGQHAVLTLEKGGGQIVVQLRVVRWIVELLEEREALPKQITHGSF